MATVKICFMFMIPDEIDQLKRNAISSNKLKEEADMAATADVRYLVILPRYMVSCCSHIITQPPSEGHFTPKNLMRLWQKSFFFCKQIHQKSVKILLF